MKPLLARLSEPRFTTADRIAALVTFCGVIVPLIVEAVK